MKKVLLILLSMALVLSMAGTVAGELTESTTPYIDQPTGTVSQSVTVSYTISENYTVKIPTHFTFTENDDSEVTASARVSVDIDRIGEGEYVWVNVTSSQYTDHWNLKSDNSNDQDLYPYHMGVTGGPNDHPDFEHEHESVCIENGGEVMRVPANTLSEVNQYIHLKLMTVPTSAATYNDSLTFTINVGSYS